MAEAALYILAGLTLYAGGHHLYTGMVRTSAYPHWQLGGLYLLLAGFALTSGMTFQSPTLETLLPTGKLDISFGLILWTAMVWHVAFRTGYKPLIMLDLITAAWAILLVRNLMAPNSLLYADVTPVERTLLSRETLAFYYTSVSPWWSAVELAMLGSLVFCFYACYRQYRRGQQTLALVTATGLGLLGLVTLHDHLVTTQVIRAEYLAPYGFLLFLLPASLFPLLIRWRQQRAQKKTPPIYNLPYMPDQASFHTDVSQLGAPLKFGTERKHRRPAVAESAAAAFAVNVASSDINKRGAGAARPAPGPTTAVPAEPDEPAAPAINTLLLHTVTDNLIDIAVFATMALNRFKRGDADPQTLEALCKKIRTQAIKTRRLTHQLVPPDDKTGPDGDTSGDA